MNSKEQRLIDNSCERNLKREDCKKWREMTNNAHDIN